MRTAKTGPRRNKFDAKAKEEAEKEAEKRKKEKREERAKMREDEGKFGMKPKGGGKGRAK